MTNYMELIMTNQPLNLIFFMAIPVILAESLVVTEFYCLRREDNSEGLWQSLNRTLGIIAGIYFAAVVVYFLINILPALEWRGVLDEVAVVAYLAGVVPLLSITLLKLGIIGRNFNDNSRRKIHFLLLTGFLILSHVAMIFGMTEPTLAEMPMDHEHMHHHH